MTTADFVQIVSVPLEITGLVLTVVENFFKNRNALLETKFQGQLQNLENFWNSSNWLSWTIFWSAWIMFAIVLYQIGERTTPEYPWQYDAYMILFFGMFYTYMIHRFLIKLLPDRKLLAFAITLSAIGVAGEIYQVSKLEF